MEKSLKSVAVNYGVYLSLILVSFTIIGYAIDLELLVNFWLVMLLLPLICIIFGIISSAKAKSMLNGFISFKQAFSSYFITIAIGILISTLVTFILFNYVDQEAAIILKEIVLEKTVSLMENFGAPASEIEKAMIEMEKQDTFAITTQLKSLAQGFVFYSIIGLLVALIMKKNDPDAA
ncbi:hypothetical protein ADIWIN_3022 [Winogradskyella psychrotolerans RS-3]|uniref:DUF4199 domain-containing protein n=1 Tax=Winogradskyella psychrotolerans RS-3 TaxID=641526 RepID=S7X833_9FLAO|nr:DUF4199 domain-containing protein [Winogradskyella psychrotolerans]EPR72183.1 hypothetical protein ADIWIN_3022 [Winogradskyella psychrotolerans RS-3]